MRRYGVPRRAIKSPFLLTSALIGVLLLMGVGLARSEAVAPPIFIDETGTAGMSYSGDTYGLGWGDFDGDGHLDLLALNHLAPPALYHNKGDGTFTDVLDGSGIAAEGDRHDSGWVDYDNDGDVDLYIAIGGRAGHGEGPNQLYQNDGLGHFVDVAEEAGVTDTLGRGRGAAWADYDNDGDPDLYVAGSTSRLYRNDGSVFTDVTSSAGVEADRAGAPTWGDYDNDGDLDLYVSSGHGKGMRDYQTLDDNVITFVAAMGPNDLEDGLDVGTSDGAQVTFHLQELKGNPIQDPRIIFLGPDGHHPEGNPFTLSGLELGPPEEYVPGEDEGFFIWQSAAGEWHIRWTAPDLPIDLAFSGLITATTPISEVVEWEFEELPVLSFPDHLFRNEGDGTTFMDVTADANVACEVDSRGAAWGDYDNDGDLDLFLVVAGDVSGNEPDRLYQNNGAGTFDDVAAVEGVTGSGDGRGWSAMWADYDNDGFLDLCVNHRHIVWPIPPGSHQLFHNQGNGNHWLKLELIGRLSNRDSLGAKVWVTVGGEAQFRERDDESPHYAHYNGPLHVGLGANTQADEVRIQWPNRITPVLILTDVPADQLLTLYEPEPPHSFYLPLIFK